MIARGIHTIKVSGQGIQYSLLVYDRILGVFVVMREAEVLIIILSDSIM